MGLTYEWDPGGYSPSGMPGRMILLEVRLDVLATTIARVVEEEQRRRGKGDEETHQRSESSFRSGRRGERSGYTGLRTVQAHATYRGYQRERHASVTASRLRESR